MSTRRARFDVALVLGLSAGYVACELAAVPKRWTYLGIAVALLPYLSLGVPSLPAILVTTIAFAALHAGNAALAYQLVSDQALVGKL